MLRPGPAAGALALLVGVTLGPGGCGESSPGTGSGRGPAPIAVDSLPPGWGVEFEWSGGGGGSQSLRSFAPAAAFALFAGQAPHPVVSPRGFTATYSARVSGDAPGRYRFGIEAAGGRATLAVYDSAATKRAEAVAAGDAPAFTPWVELVGPAPGATLSVKFTRSGDASARLRTWWEREGAGLAGFMAEPVPPGVTRVPSFAAASAGAGIAEQRGRMLIGRLGCAHCHAPPPAPVIGGDGHGTHAFNPAVPHSLAPVLGEVADRASAAWLRRWIAGPQTIAPGSAMPDVFHGDPGDEADIEAVVHFLVSIAPRHGQRAPAEHDSAAVDRGRSLYHSVGCVVCHGPFDPPTGDGGAPGLPDTKPPAPFPDLAGKWSAPALCDFLLNPALSRPQGRMPGMALTAAEAGDVAAYLVDRFGAGEGSSLVVDPAKATRGRIVYTSRGCASCHTLGQTWTQGDPRREIVSTLRPRGIAAIRPGAGCLDPKDVRSPRYTLSNADRGDIEAGLDMIRRTAEGAALAPIDDGRMGMDDLGCRRCHETEGVGGPDDALRPYFRDHAGVALGDEGRFPPRLTGVGWKLKTPWMRNVLTQAGRARPYMTTRMPQFGDSRAMSLAETFAAMEGVFPTTDEAAPEATDERVFAGRRLVGDTGLNCITCHTVGDLPPVSTPGPDLQRATERNRYEWWRRYVQNPARFKIGTRMPTFFATGRGTVTDVYGGDPVRQSEAIWAYLSLGDRMPPPPGAVAGDTAGRISDRPVVVPAFLAYAGRHAIAVGFPAGLHFAFDAEACRLVAAWRGDFRDGRGSWSGRAGEVLGGGGGAVWKTQAGPVLLIGGSESPPGQSPSARFGGYRLDEGGVPTFAYAFGTAAVEERVEPTAAGRSFRRVFTVSGLAAGDSVWFDPGPGVQGVFPGPSSTHRQPIGGEGAWHRFTGIDGSLAFEARYQP